MDVYYSRRLLLQTPLHHQPSATGVPAALANTGDTATLGNSFDANFVMILAVLLCALISALGFSSILHFILCCYNWITPEPEANPAVRPRAGVRKALRSVPTVVYRAGLKLPGAGSECAICLSDFVPGERLRVMPNCNHGFHVRCVDRWLLSRPSCPTCRQCLLGSCNKTSACGETSRTQVIIVPLEHEGVIGNYHR